MEPQGSKSVYLGKGTFSSWILSSILFEATSWALKRAIVLVSSGSKMLPLSSRTTRSKPSILERKEWSAGPQKSKLFMGGPRGSRVSECRYCTSWEPPTGSSPSNPCLLSTPQWCESTQDCNNEPHVTICRVMGSTEPHQERQNQHWLWLTPLSPSLLLFGQDFRKTNLTNLRAWALVSARPETKS